MHKNKWHLTGALAVLTAFGLMASPAFADSAGSAGATTLAPTELGTPQVHAIAATLETTQAFESDIGVQTHKAVTKGHIEAAPIAETGTIALDTSPPEISKVNNSANQTLADTSPHTITITANTQSTAGGTAELGQAINTSTVNSSAGTTIAIGGNNDVICPTITVQADNNSINPTITATTVTIDTCANELATNTERIAFGHESVTLTANQSTANTETAQVANHEGVADVAFPTSRTSTFHGAGTIDATS